MNRRLAMALLLATSVVAAAALVGSDVLGGQRGQLSERWTSDTIRDTEGNHHPIGATADGGVVLAPVAVPASAHGADEHDHHGRAHGSHAPGACALVSLARDGAVEWRYTVPSANCSAHALTEPTVADVDGDGTREGVVGTTERAVLVLGPGGAVEQRIQLSSYGYGRPTVGDLTAAPGPEIAASDIRGNLVVADRAGVAWRGSIGGTVYPAPVIVDVDGTPGPELLVASSERTVAFKPDGAVAWSAPVAGWTLATADVDEDPALEAFVTDTDAVTALDGRTGAVEWERDVDGTPTVGAVAGDAGRVFVGLNGGRLLSLDAETGKTAWEASVPTDGQRRTPPPVVGDLTGDGTTEVVAVTNDGGLAVVDAESGRVTASRRVDAHFWTRATLADLDADGDQEVLLRRGDGRVLAMDYRE